MPDAALLDAAFTTVREGVESGKLPSAVLAVANARDTLRVEAYGPVETDSIFLLASITKPIFATAVMQQVERGRIGLNNRIATVIPEFAERGKDDVRLWHLLTHTSGMDENWLGPVWGTGDRRALHERALGAPLLFRPGSRYQYCNVSFAAMAELLQRLTGKDDRELLRAEVLEPLGMKDTGYAPEGARVAPVHDPPWGDDPKGRSRWCSLAVPAGGLWSTAADLVRFGQAFLRRGQPVIAPATVRAMTALQTGGLSEYGAAGEFSPGYGLGFGKRVPGSSSGPSTELTTPQGFGHGGATGTDLWVEPEHDLVFVFLTNKWGLEAPFATRARNAVIAGMSA